MMKKLLILIFFFTLQACNHDDGASTELEGSWASICITSISPSLGFDLFDSTFTGPPSSRIIHTFHGNSTSTAVEIYTDTDCINLDSTVSTIESNLFVNVDDIPITFKTGEQITSANGVQVKEIDFITANGTIIKNIYLLQDDNNTLYFGIGVCSAPLGTCPNERPTEIFYDFPYTKIN